MNITPPPMRPHADLPVAIPSVIAMPNRTLPRLGAASALIVMLLSSLPARAAEVVILEPVMIKGKRSLIADQPQRLKIVSAIELQQSGSNDLAQLLKLQASFAVREYGAAGALSSATIRGSLGEGVLILRDGIKLNNPERGGVDLSTVSLTSVDHVEILYGGSSSLYGSEAIGGVINLISKKESSNRLEAGFGTFGERHLVLDGGQTLGDTSFAFGLRRAYAENDFPYFYRDAVWNRENAKLDSTDLSLGVRQKWNYDQLDLNLNLKQATKGVPGPVNFPSKEATQKDLALLGALKWSQHWGGELKQDTTLSHQHSGLGYSDPRSVIDPGNDSALDSTDLQTQVVWQSEPQELRVGAGLTNDALNSTKLGFKHRLTGTVFLHESWFMNALTWLADLRMDDSSVFGLNASPRLGFTYFLNEGSHFRGALGQAYRGPSFNDLYWPSSTYAQGNPALQPETTRVYELGWDYVPWTPLKLETTLFYNQGFNTIMWQPGTGGVWSPINLGATETRGLELVASYQPLEMLSFQGDGTWLSAIDRSTGSSFGKALMYRPALIGKVTMTLRPVKDVSVHVGWGFTDKRFTTALNTDFLPSYQLWTGGLSYQPFPGDTFILKVDNLLNEYYQSQPYYPMPGRAIRGSWAHAF